MHSFHSFTEIIPPGESPQRKAKKSIMEMVMFSGCAVCGERQFSWFYTNGKTQSREAVEVILLLALEIL